MKPIKNNVITFRVNDETKSNIDNMAEEKEWSTSQVIEKICKIYFEERRTPKMTAKEAIEKFEEMIRESLEKAEYQDFDKEDTITFLHQAVTAIKEEITTEINQ